MLRPSAARPEPLAMLPPVPERSWIADRWHGEKTGTGLRWRVVWIDPHTKREKSKSFRKKTDAESFQSKTEDSLRAETYVSAEVAALTVRDAAEAWMNSKKKPKAASLARYRAALDDRVLPRWGGTLLSAIKRQDVDQWLSDLLDGSAPRREGMRAHKGGMSPATVRAAYMPLNAALRYAVQEGWLRRNPATGAELPVLDADPVIFLTHIELEALTEAAREHATHSDAVMVGVMGNSGLRPGEAIALTVQDVDLNRRRISVSRTVTIDGKGKSILGMTPKTRAGNREVPIPPHLLPDLKALMKDRPASDLLFRTASGAALNMSNWRNRTWKTITKAAHSPTGLTPKGLRHTAASLAIDSGADVLMVQRMLGHADAKETLNTYAKLFPDRLDEVTEKMSKARDKALAARSS